MYKVLPLRHVNKLPRLSQECFTVCSKMLVRGKKVRIPGFHVSQVAVPRSTLIHEF